MTLLLDADVVLPMCIVIKRAQSRCHRARSCCRVQAHGRLPYTVMQVAGRVALENGIPFIFSSQPPPAAAKVCSRSSGVEHDKF